MNSYGPTSTPTAAQSRALNELKRITNRHNPDFAAAAVQMPRAIGSNPGIIEQVRQMAIKPHLSPKQKLEFVQIAIPEADKAMYATYGADCFTPENQVYGHFWRLQETRGFIRLLLDAVNYAADADEWQVAVDQSRRILEMNHGDNNGIRDRVPLFLLHTDKPLDSLNFCLSWLDTNHDGYDGQRYCPKGGYADLERYKKEDFDANKPVSIPIQNLGHAGLIFNAALSAFHLFGDSNFATSWLREGHKANPHVVDILLRPESEWPTKPDPSPRGLGSVPEASDYVHFATSLWKKEEVKEWVRNTEKDVRKKECSNISCKKVESERGEFKVCAGCRGSWYCGVECQTEDWKLNGHKRRCKKEKEIRELTEKMGKGVNWGR